MIVINKSGLTEKEKQDILQPYANNTDGMGNYEKAKSRVERFIDRHEEVIRSALEIPAEKENEDKENK